MDVAPRRRRSTASPAPADAAAALRLTTRPAPDAPDAPAKPLASTSRQAHAVAPLPPDQIPEFPPPGVILHRDDVGSKVFLAIARSLLSVDNRATTVKDLADLALNHGLGCQTPSAATQAITTYLRTHNERCEQDHDQPLLLSHNMSGTVADDDLIPGLYSLQGGNPRKPGAPDDARLTSFRKNTTVWYLSRATGVPCPFARAGIRLCDYDVVDDEDGGDQSRRRSKHPDRHLAAGQKRKRALRSCVAKGSSESESEPDEETPPPKKLVLRLKLNTLSRPPPQQTPNDTDNEPLSDEPMVVDSSEKDAAEDKQEEREWRLPPYPRRSISIPCYTPSYEGAYPQFPESTSYYQDPFRRSPSLACSSGSPPPDSEDEADDFHITMTRTDVLPDDSYSESESEGETQFESPGPRSPSAPLLPSTITVKEEPRDLQGLLDAWDDFDSGLVDAGSVNEPTYLPAKSEPLDWDSDWGEPTARIKQEDHSLEFALSESSLSTPSLSDTSSPLRETDDFPSRTNTIRLRFKTEPTFTSRISAPSIASSSSTSSSASSSSAPPPPPTAPIRDNSEAESSTLHEAFTSANLPPSIASLIESMNALCSPSPAISPSSLILNPISPSAGSDVVLVHTCQPCTPSISATQIEDISVYQMVLGNFHFLRRIDTDFVNLSPIVAYTQSPFPVITTIPNATVIAKGSPAVAGIWIPLSAAQAYIKDHPTKGGEFDVFLSDQLYERFPSALQDFVKNNAPTRLFNQFGRPFTSQLPPPQPYHPTPASFPSDPLGQQSPLHQLQTLMSISTSSDAYSLSSALSISEKQHAEMVEPLSATEQEIFELCVVPDWDKDVDSGSSGQADTRVAPDTESRGSEVDMDVEDSGNISDTSSLSSLASSPEASGEVASIKEEEVQSSPTVPPPPQEPRSGVAPCASASITMEEGEDGGGAVGPQTKRKASASNSRQPRVMPLRRSKRVADLATHQPSGSAGSSSAATRSQRRGSRNSLA